MRKENAHSIAMKQCIDKGRNPVALIDGLLQFIENHIDGYPMDDANREVANKAISAMRTANVELDDVLNREGVGETYYTK